MAIEYEPINWKDNSTETPVNAENLNKMDAAIKELCDGAGGGDTYVHVDDNLKAIDGITFGLDENNQYGYYNSDNDFIEFNSGGGSSSGGTGYSGYVKNETKEKCIGVDINGKPIYSINIELPNNFTAGNIDISVYKIDNVLRGEIIGYDSPTGNKWIMSLVSYSSNRLGYFNNDYSQLKIEGSFYKSRVYLEYTKSIDSENSFDKTMLSDEFKNRSGGLAHLEMDKININESLPASNTSVRTIYTFTADKNCTFNFSGVGYTDTGSNDGAFDVYINDILQEQIVLSTSTYQSLNILYDLSKNDILTIKTIWYRNPSGHSNCQWKLIGSASIITDSALAADDNLIANGGLTFGLDGDGNYGYYKADDSFVPFKSGGDINISWNHLNIEPGVYATIKGDFSRSILLWRWDYRDKPFYGIVFPNSNGGRVIYTDETYSSISYPFSSYTIDQLLITERSDTSITFLSDSSIGTDMYYKIIPLSIDNSIYTLLNKSFSEFTQSADMYAIGTCTNRYLYFNDDKNSWVNTAVLKINFSTLPIDLKSFSTLQITLNRLALSSEYGFFFVSYINRDLDFGANDFSNTLAVVSNQNNILYSINGNINKENYTFDIDIPDDIESNPYLYLGLTSGITSIPTTTGDNTLNAECTADFQQIILK